MGGGFGVFAASNVAYTVYDGSSKPIIVLHFHYKSMKTSVTAPHVRFEYLGSGIGS